MSDFNDYYTNNDDNSSYDNYDRDVINNLGTNFSVSIMKKLYVALLLFVIIYSAIFCFSIPLLIDLANSGLRQSMDLAIIFMVCMLLLVVFFFLNSAGRRIDISGNSIHIRKWFIFNEETSIINVSHCDVITGLSSYNRYGIRIYNKAVVYYDSGKSVSITDNTYLGWQQLVDYMNYNRKVVNIDGRSTFIKWFENFYDNHRNLF